MLPKQSYISEANINHISAKRISIIILSWNTKELLKRCLRSIYSGYTIDTHRYKVEIIIVDNGSTDGSREMVRSGQWLVAHQSLVTFRLIENQQNLGFAKGNNQGIKVASGELIMILNSDTIVQKGAIEKLASFINHHNDVAAISPLLLNDDGSIQKDPCYLRFPSPLTSFLYYNKFLKRLTFKFFPSLLLSKTDFTKPTEVDQLPGAAMMVRKKILDEVGGFDEKFPIYFEDVDLSFRIRRVGYKLLVVPDAKVIHLGRKSIEPVIEKEGMEKFYFLNFNSLFLFCEKNYPSWKTLMIKIIIFLHLILGLKLRLVGKLIQR